MRPAALFALAFAACTSEFEPVRRSSPLVPLEHPSLGARSTRDPRRLSHLQLTRSVQALMGTTWIEDGLNVLGVLGPTLGDPDYQEITTENLDASPLYVKFMEDMALNVCANAPLAVLAPKGNPDEDIRALKLKLHGEWIPVGDASLEPLRRLHDTDGIRAVCVALLGAPEFYLY